MNAVENAIETVLIAVRTLLESYQQNPLASTKEQAELVYRLAFDAANAADIADAIYVKDFIRRVERVAEDVGSRQAHLMLVDAGQWFDDSLAELRQMMRQQSALPRSAPFLAIETAKDRVEAIEDAAIRSSIVGAQKPVADEPEWTAPKFKKHLAKLYGITTETLRKRIAAGKIQTKDNVGQTVRILEAEYQRLTQKQPQESPTRPKKPQA